jgi:hypothetical protein
MKNSGKKNKSEFSVKLMAGILAALMIASVVFGLLAYLV